MAAIPYEQEYGRYNLPSKPPPYNTRPDWQKEVAKAPLKSNPPATDWVTVIKGKNWDRIKQVWDDFLNCDYDERCDALFSIMEEIVSLPSESVVPTIANCPEKDAK
jgi:hypothetical protein